MAIKSKFPALRPTLDLNFAATKKLDPRITFGRVSTATYYDGKTVAKAEENLLTWSEAFDNAAWTKSRSAITANASVSPDGAPTADLIYPTVSDGICYAYTEQILSTLNADYTLSVYAKASGFPWFYLGTVTESGANTAWFNLSTGVVGTKGASITSASIESVGNGWYRCVLKYAAAVARRFVCGVSDSDNALTATVNGTDGVLVWGAQAEQRSQVTAYTPTTDQPITKYQPVLLTAPANTPRFDHNPITGESLGLLVEETRTNLLTYSEQFSDAVWGKSQATVSSNVMAAPDGSLTADKIIENTANARHGAAELASVSVGTYTYSVFAKAGEKPILKCLRATVHVDSFSHSFNLLTGVASGTGASMIPVGNGWYRCVGTISINTASSTGVYFYISNTDTEVYEGDGRSGIYIWGAQLEAGAFPTSYIKTEDAQVTRSDDVASMSGSNFSGWFRQDEGALFADFKLFDNQIATTNKAVVRLGNITLYNNFNWFGPLSGVQSTSPAAGFTTSPVKIIMGYARDGRVTSKGGAAVVSAVGNSTNSGDGLAFGSGSVSPGGIGYTKHIKKIAYYPKRLSNTELQALTA